MATSMYAAISGLKNHQTWMDVIGNNISNVNTTGFKYGRVTFKSMFSQTLGAASGFNGGANLGGVNPTQIGLGMALSTVDTIMTQGALQTTGNPLDMAIVGDGMFMVRSGTSTVFTRAGNFGRDSGGNVVSSGGQFVQGWMGRYTYSTMGGPAGINPIGQMITGWQAPDPNNPVGNISIPTGLTIAASQTNQVQFAGNLDALTQQNLNWNYLSVGGIPHGTSTVGATLPAGPWQPDAVSSITIYDSLGNPIRLRTEFYQVAQTTTSGGTAPAAWNYYTFIETDQGLAFVGNLFDPAATPPAGQITPVPPPPDWQVPTGFAGQLGFNSDGSVKYHAALQGLDSAVPSSRGIAAPGGLLPPYITGAGVSVWAPGAVDQANLSFSLWEPNTPPATFTGLGMAPVGKTVDPQAGATVPGTPVPGKLEIINWGTAYQGGMGTAFGSVTYWNGNLAPTLLNMGLRDGLTGDVTGSYQIINGVSTYVPQQTAYLAAQNGYSSGVLTGMSVDPLGIIQGGFTNGQTIPLAQIAVIQFANMTGLAGAGNTNFAATINSGLPIAGAAGQRGTGLVVGGALEQSNVDLASELTNMIVAQRGFDANSRIITTSSEMMDTLVNLGRR